MKERAYAKINLCLNVTQRRPDGYHEMEMIMVPIEFYDLVELEFSSAPMVFSNARYLPVDQRNSVIKAIEVMREEFGFIHQFAVTLTKHIPTQAGLAGGSADAAAAMRLIVRMLHLDTDEATLNELAKKVGADVPFCLQNRPALVTGIGEKLEFFDFEAPFFLFLLKPYRGVSTRQAFEALDLTLCDHPDALKMKDALIAQDYPGILFALGNSLEQSAFTLLPDIAHAKEALLAYGFDGALMSGSGSCVFALTQDESLVDRACLDFKQQGYFVRKTRIRTQSNPLSSK